MDASNHAVRCATFDSEVPGLSGAVLDAGFILSGTASSSRAAADLWFGGLPPLLELKPSSTCRVLRIDSMSVLALRIAGIPVGLMAGWGSA
jgi:hypothetical protein